MKHHYMFLFSLMLIAFVPLIFSTPSQDEQLNKLPTSAPSSPTTSSDENETSTVIGPLSHEEILKSYLSVNKLHVETRTKETLKIAETITALQAKKQ